MNEHDKVLRHIRHFDDMLDEDWLNEEIEALRNADIKPGSVILIYSMPGTYKSTLAFQIAYEYLIKNKDKNGIYLSLEQSRLSLMRDLRGKGFDVDGVKNLAIRDFGRERGELKDLFDLIDEVCADLDEEEASKAGGKNEVTFLNMAHKEIEEWYDEEKSKFVIFDSLGALYAIHPQMRDSVRTELFKEIQWLKEMPLYTFIIMEAKNVKALEEEAMDEEYLADGTIVLKPEADRVYMGIKKMRDVYHKRGFFMTKFEKGKGITIGEEQL